MRTNADVFVTIISEATGKPKSLIASQLEKARKAFPGKDSFDTVLTEREYSDLLAKLRPEKSGILNWFLQLTKTPSDNRM